MLFSLSLLTNAIADEGFVHHFLEGSTKEMWTWDLFYITDYILIIGALYWYNRFQNSMTIPVNTRSQQMIYLELGEQCGHLLLDYYI